jgi:hypothetical protein
VRQRARFLLVAALLWLSACDSGRNTDRQRMVAAPDPPTNAGSPSRTTAGARVEQSTSTHTGAPDAGGRAEVTSLGGSDEILVGEERERDPRSETVKIKVLGGDKRQAHVFWGRKDLGVAPLEIERPRHSGPVDLVVMAPGYLPFHARAFTDRDDLISVHLYSAAEAPQLLGYRASEVPVPPRPAVPPSGNQNSLENSAKTARSSTAKTPLPVR